MSDPIQFPKHACGLILTHNEHKSYYDKIEDYLAEERCGSFRDAESRQRCIATNEVWELQWYPNTPVGFLSVYAPTLAECLAYAIEVSEADEGSVE